MNDDRSRDALAGQADADREGAREPWYERLLHRLHLKSRDSIRDDLEDALKEVGEDRSFSPQERAMLKNVLGFHRIRVEDVMVPRADIVSVAADITLGELLSVFRTAGHSRLPVYGETLDDPRGMVHIRDFLDFLSARAEAGGSRRRRQANAPVHTLGNVDLSRTLASARILRPVLFVPRSMPAIDLLVRMQATRTHMALVIDEYGGTDGLVSIEDLVEMVVGDIEDEHDDAATAMIRREDDDTFVADGRASLEEASAEIGADLGVNGMAEEIDTVSGLVVTLAGRVPSRGELIAGPGGLEFEVLDADPRRLKRVRIHRHASKSDERAKPGPTLDEPGAADLSEAEDTFPPDGGTPAAFPDTMPVEPVPVETVPMGTVPEPGNPFEVSVPGEEAPPRDDGPLPPSPTAGARAKVAASR